jgi:hypothetical protein
MVKRGPTKYKKAPQAPRRFKSSYMFFSTEKHKSIRKEFAERGGGLEKVGCAVVISISFLILRMYSAGSLERLTSISLFVLL